jgi:UDP-N-acetylmuramyl pentapeptide phosphotransferase/UDP-N-acetylglucosamine-1-phosphate transferase
MPIYVNLTITFIAALCISLYATRIVVNVVQKLGFMDKPNIRSAAQKPIPTLGGIAIFFSFVFVSTIALSGNELPEMTYIITAMLLIFFVGLKDDIVTLSPAKKITAQIIAASIIVFMAEIRFTHLHGLLGIGEIGIIPSFLITAFTIVVIINAFNLMDGIDGLAAGLSILAAFVFGCWFYISGHTGYAFLCASLIGAIGGFFYMNVYGHRYKIFMVDTGSLVLGTIISIFVIQFNEFNINQNQTYALASSPGISFGILFYPLFDTVRVMVIRILNRRSPFSADKNHLHHRLLLLGNSHRKSTYIIIGMNILFIMLVFGIHHLGVHRLLVSIAIIGSFLFMVPAFIIQRKHLIKENDPVQQLLIPSSGKVVKRRRVVVNGNQKKQEHQLLTRQTFFQKLNLW